MLNWIERLLCAHDWRTFDRAPSRCLTIDRAFGGPLEVWFPPISKQRCCYCGKERTIRE